MFWFGLSLVLICGLLSIPIIKNRLINLRSKLNESRIDKVILITFLFGLIISSAQHVADENEIESLTLTVENFKYSKIAEYNIYGNLSGKIIGVPFIKSPIQDWGRKYIIKINDTTFDSDCGSEALNKYFEVNEIIPEYPFTYYFIALCYKKSGDKDWVNFAKKTKTILLETIKIPDHHMHHDVILNQVKELLIENE